MSADSAKTSDTNVHETEAAKQAAQQAVEQARQTAEQAAATIRAMDATRLGYIGCLVAVVVFTLVVDMASFSVGVDYAVSETTAQAQREMEAKLNSWSYSAFSSCMWGKLMWLSAVGGIGLLMWSAMTKSKLAWVPLAMIGTGAICSLCLMLIFFVGFPDFSEYHDTTCSATLFGYWIPLLCSIAATYLAAKPIFFSRKP